MELLTGVKFLLHVSACGTTHNNCCTNLNLEPKKGLNEKQK